MGLDELTSETSDSGNDTQNNSRQYVKITDDEMMEFFDKRAENWDVVDHPSGEVVMGTRDFAPMESKLMLLCFTTIDEYDNVSRDKGADAIRLIAWHREAKKPIGGRKKTLRIKTWKKNLNHKIDSMVGEGKEVGSVCEDCGAMMVVKEGQYGEFLGCTEYPDCEYTENYDQ